MATELQLLANRQNAQASTGPVSVEGKAKASRNALRHGIMSARLILDDEDPAEFQALFDDLVVALAPVGAMELLLVERIAVSIWRQRRLVNAEAAGIELARRPIALAKAVNGELQRGYANEVGPEQLKPYDRNEETFFRAVLDEIEALEVVNLENVRSSAPTVFGRLETDTKGEAPANFLATRPDGLIGYIKELELLCRTELRRVDERSRIMEIAEMVRARVSIPKGDTLERLSRYQATLDTQCYKALRALRESQEWRLKTVESVAEMTSSSGDEADAA
jgi:hypothetical protein